MNRRQYLIALVIAAIFSACGTKANTQGRQESLDGKWEVKLSETEDNSSTENVKMTLEFNLAESDSGAKASVIRMEEILKLSIRPRGRYVWVMLSPPLSPVTIWLMRTLCSIVCRRLGVSK